jgi:hypothetical protein
MLFINQIIALIINQDKPTHAIAIVAVLIQLLPFVAFLSSDHADNIKNQQYNT